MNRPAPVVLGVMGVGIVLAVGWANAITDAATENNPTVITVEPEPTVPGSGESDSLDWGECPMVNQGYRSPGAPGNVTGDTEFTLTFRCANGVTFTPILSETALMNIVNNLPEGRS